MKKILFAFAILFISTTALKAQDTIKNTAVPQAHFNELKHEFGNIPHAIPATTTFTFTNTGKTPLVIETATATCGCTTPIYPKKPILPGKKGDIKVTYNAQVMGHFVKMVDVKFAQFNRPVNLVINGDVVEKSGK